jgi:hypothetical protein
MKENAQKMKWLPDVLVALGGPGNEHESLLDLLTCIGQNDNYKAMWEEAIRYNGLVLPTLGGVTTEAVQVIFTEYKIQQVLSLEHMQPRTSSYKYRKEKIDWSYKLIKQVFKLWLKSCTKGPNGFQCNHLGIVVTINHGKGAS